MGKRTPDDITTEAAQALFRFARLFSRPARQMHHEPDAPTVELSRILVVESVESMETATVGSVAQHLDIDPSTASRLVAQTIRDGYLVRVASQEDGRRALLELTAAGKQLADAARSYQLKVFMRATQDLTPKERDTFARQFVAFADSIVTQRDEPNE